MRWTEIFLQPKNCNMCGRFTQIYTWREVHDALNLIGTNRNLPARYNVAPTDPVDVVVARGDKLELSMLRWGLVPGWWKKSLKEMPATFNARAETIAEKPMFRTGFRHKRCVIPASGFYEWQTVGKIKQPYYFSARSGGPLWMAGVWDDWTDPVSADTLLSCTIIVGEANRFVQPLHDRMPVLLDASMVRSWIFNEMPHEELLRPARNDLLQVWPVSTDVNRVGKMDDAHLIAAVGQHVPLI